ncbi:hypothetical protein BD410DRAFT_828384 [Rickenella mellea]|uniref:RhoGAP-domain-containing protein n=1 Tax=Rickenella mellea TaxID=50990 RepID=A0A4Y7Q716_9AGAM|nr:hypothetical protein BD410DRAFT_828384 [Rickenella mellea]
MAASMIAAESAIGRSANTSPAHSRPESTTTFGRVGGNHSTISAEQTHNTSSFSGSGEAASASLRDASLSAVGSGSLNSRVSSGNPTQLARVPKSSTTSDDSKWGANFWVTLLEPQTQTPFFACPATGEVSWDPPVGHFVLPPSEDGEWWELCDESRGGIPYYYHTKTNETVWEKPDVGFVIPFGILQNTALGRSVSLKDMNRLSQVLENFAPGADNVERRASVRRQTRDNSTNANNITNHHNSNNVLIPRVTSGDGAEFADAANRQQMVQLQQMQHQQQHYQRPRSATTTGHRPGKAYNTANNNTSTNGNNAGQTIPNGKTVRRAVSGDLHNQHQYQHQHQQAQSYGNRGYAPPGRDSYGYASGHQHHVVLPPIPGSPYATDSSSPPTPSRRSISNPVPGPGSPGAERDSAEGKPDGKGKGKEREDPFGNGQDGGQGGEARMNGNGQQQPVTSTPPRVRNGYGQQQQQQQQQQYVPHRSPVLPQSLDAAAEMLAYHGQQQQQQHLQQQQQQQLQYQQQQQHSPTLKGSGPPPKIAAKPRNLQMSAPAPGSPSQVQRSPVMSGQQFHYPEQQQQQQGPGSPQTQTQTQRSSRQHIEFNLTVDMSRVHPTNTNDAYSPGPVSSTPLKTRSAGALGSPGGRIVGVGMGEGSGADMSWLNMPPAPSAGMSVSMSMPNSPAGRRHNGVGMGSMGTTPSPESPSKPRKSLSGPGANGTGVTTKNISGPMLNMDVSRQMDPVKRSEGRPILVEPRRRVDSYKSDRKSESSSLTGHRVLPDDLASDIQQFVQADFARQYFSTHRTGFIFRRRVPVEQLMMWQKTPLTSPLLVLNKTLQKDAVKIFKVIQRIMGDRERDRPVGVRVPSETHLSSSLAGTSMYNNGSTTSLPSGVVGVLEEERWVLGEGLLHGELRDEIYCQLVKQLTGNPSPESLFRGWQFLCVLLVTFPPSKNFEAYLRTFMQQRTVQTEGRVDVMAKYCLQRLSIIAKKGPRGKPPTIAEIETASDAAFNPSTFGESLDAVFRLQERTYGHLQIPIILPFLADGILALGGTKSEGIFRIPGDGDLVSELKLRIERGYYNLEDIDDPHVPASLLKLWLRELCDPLVPDELYNDCVACSKDPDACVQMIARLPTANRRVVLFVISFLQLFLDDRVQGVTKMTSANLALVMAPNLLRCNSDSMTVVFTNAQYEQTFVHNLLLHLKCNKVDPDYVPKHGLGAVAPADASPRLSKSRNRRPR